MRYTCLYSAAALSVGAITCAVEAKTPVEVSKDAPMASDAGSKPSASIVVLGSSTAAGYGLADPSTSWVQRYASYLSSHAPGSKVTNLAVPGYTSYHVLPTGSVNPNGRPAVDPAHNITAALALHPDAIIVNLPSNDAAMSVPVEESMANMKKVAAKAKDAHVAIWITTTQPRQLAPQGITLLLRLRDRTEHEFGDHAIDFFTPLAAPDGTPLPKYNQGDGIHPNAEGHRLLFEQAKTADLPTALGRPAASAGASHQ
jgi:lysophospholipase L1-like esterase